MPMPTPLQTKSERLSWPRRYALGQTRFGYTRQTRVAKYTGGWTSVARRTGLADPEAITVPFAVDEDFLDVAPACLFWLR
jgi:hypothetical protein